MIDFYFFLVGSILASFLGLVIDRFPEHSIIRPASHCDSCQTRLHPLDLIPILSLIFASNPIIVVSITTILALAIAIHFIYFYVTQNKKYSKSNWGFF